MREDNLIGAHMRALEASERRFCALLERTMDPIVVVDAQRKISYISRALCTLLKCDEESAIGQSALDFVKPRSVETLLATIKASDTGGSSEQGPFDLHVTARDGTDLCLEGYRTNLLADPYVKGILWNMRDVTDTRLAETQARLSEERLTALEEGSADVTFIFDDEGAVKYASPACKAVFGYDPDELIGLLPDTMPEFIHPDDIAILQEVFEETRKIGRCSARYRARHADSSWRWVDGRFRDLTRHDAVGGIVANIRDVTEEHLAAEALRDSELRFRSIVETAAEGVWIHDLEGRTEFANAKMASILGTTLGDLYQSSVDEFLDHNAQQLHAQRIIRRRLGISDQYELTMRPRTGDDVHAVVSASPVRDPAGNIIGVLKMVTDITARRRAEEENERLALHDSLTGLANRALVMDRLNQMLHRIERSGGSCTLMFLDVDGFKKINDSLGHPAGDELLLGIAGRLKDSMLGDHTIGRVGGDEFVIVLDTAHNPESAIVDADRVLAALRVPLTIAGTSVVPSVSIGIASTPVPDAVTLWRNADVAMYEAKRVGGDRYELFDYTLHDAAVARVELERDIRIAITNDEFSVYFQPLVSHEGGIIGAEALIRWFHPVRGSVSPGDFIPVAEEAELIRDIEALVLDTSLRELASWRRATGQDDLIVAVNVSGKHVNDPTLSGQVQSLLAKHALPPSALCLEITETALMADLMGATKTLTELHRLGVRLALDDFGTGYSSLVYLRRLPVQLLKLDRVFISGVDANPQDAAIIQAVIALAHSLGMHAVAEGVETQRQADELWAMGCDHAQGFLWSAAVPSDQLVSMLRTNTIRTEGVDPMSARGDLRAHTGLVAAPDTGRMLEPISRLR
jgi:diguanylate cyclase (GGDEF)-like protein/PAS domain S-box-containing protein